MAQIIILGSGYAIPKEGAENTHFLIRQERRSILVDCASNPMLHLPRAGVNFPELNDIILTHFHPDHVAGIPVLLMGLWLSGRQDPMHLYGLSHTLDRVEKMMQLYDYENWPGFYPLQFHVLPETEKWVIIEDEFLKIESSPMQHIIPTIGLRVDFLQQGKSVVYSSDTEPCAQLVRLAKDCDILIHEAAGETPGHSSPEQAADIAKKAHARKLYLIHYSTDGLHFKSNLEKAEAVFEGPIVLAKDFLTIDLE